jgi:hypothetical protein
MSGGFCPNCNEEVFIAEQYRELGKEVPETIANKEAEHIQNPARQYQPKYVEPTEVTTPNVVNREEDGCKRGEHDMEYPVSLGTVGGVCKRCGYSTMI